MTVTGMRVSFQMFPEHPAPDLLDAITAADELGYYACYSADEIYRKDAWLLFDLGEQARIFGERVLPEISWI